MDKLPEIFGFKAEYRWRTGSAARALSCSIHAPTTEFRERARLVQRLRGGFGRLGGGGGTGRAMRQNRSSMMSCALAALPTLGCGTRGLFVLAHGRFST